MHVFRTQQKIERAWLYQFVFHTPAIRIVLFVMAVFFALQPAVPALANEEGAAPAASQGAAEPEPEPERAPEPEPDVVPEESQEPSSVAEAAADDSPVLEAPSEPVSEPDTAPEVAVPTDPTVDADTSEAGGSAGTPVTVTEEGVESTPEVNDVPGTGGSSSSDGGAGADPAADAALEESASTTVPEPQFFEVTGELSHTDDAYRFQKAQCLSMGNGAYHCFDEGAAALSVTEEESLYVARDDDGDKEIFLKTSGGVEQVTSNRVDDDAPYFDPVSNSIVWHRQAAGSYEVVVLEDGMERVLSAGFGTSMEPHRAGRYIVWQSWVDDRWQVVLEDGQGARVISEGPGQHLAPQVEGSYVLWNVTNGDSHTVAVYELSSGLVSYIDDSEGARVMNPRFVLVYDTRFDNGDVVTKGYDAETGSVVPLAAAVPIVPAEVPSADPTGETRALLQNKTYSRDEFAEEELGGATVASSTPPDVPVASTTIAVPPVAEAPALPLTDFDLIVLPYQSTSSSQG